MTDTISPYVRREAKRLHIIGAGSEPECVKPTRFENREVWELPDIRDTETAWEQDRRRAYRASRWRLGFTVAVMFWLAAALLGWWVS